MTGDRSRILLAALLLCTAAAAPAAEESFVAGLGAELDSENGRAFAALADIPLQDRTWLGLTLAHTRSDGGGGTHDTWYAEVEMDHRFDAFGVRAGAGYWGNHDALESLDLSASLYLRKPSWALSADFERRDFDVVVGGVILPVERTAEFTADGAGLTARRRFRDRFDLYGGGMWYGYSRNVRLQRDIDSLRYLSVSRLALVNSLIDRRWHAGFETSFGLRLVDVRFSRWVTAVDGSRVDSVGVGFLTPLGKANDLELRLAFDDSETFGESTVFSVFLYFFGGS